MFYPSYILVRLDRLTIALDRAINPYILSYIGVVVGGGERVFDLSNRGAAALEESKRLFIYTLLLYRRVYFFYPHIFHPSMFPLLVCSTGSVGGAFIIR